MYSIVKRILFILGIIGFIGILDTSFMLGIIAAYAKKLGASEALSGTIAGLYSLVAIPSSIIAGLLIDKIGKKRMLILGLFSDTIFVLLYSLVSSPLQLALVRIFHAVGGSFIYPSSLALVARFSRKDFIGRGISFFLLMVALAIIVGSIGSSIIVSFFGFEWVFRVLSLIMFFGFILSLRIPIIEEKVVERFKGVITLIRSEKTNILIGLTLIFTLYFSFGFIVGGFPFVVQKSLGLTEEKAAGLTGMYIGVASIFSIPAFLLIGYLVDKKRVSVALLIGLLSLFLSNIVLVLSSVLQAQLLSSFMMGIAIGSLMTLSSWYVLRIPEEARGTGTGLQQTANILGTAIGAPTAGLLVNFGYLGLIFLVPGLLSLLIFIIMMLRIKF